MPTYTFLFADDWDVTSWGSNAPGVLLMGVLVCLVFGYPIKWEKIGGGVKYEWIGYWLDWERFQIGTSEKRSK